jgi:hypothetical protein
MKKRVLAAFLWFYAGWYAGAMVAAHTALPEVLGAVAGVGIAAFVGIDPFSLFWKDRSAASLPDGVSEPA